MSCPASSLDDSSPSLSFRGTPDEDFGRRGWGRFVSTPWHPVPNVLVVRNGESTLYRSSVCYLLKGWPLTPSEFFFSVTYFSLEYYLWVLHHSRGVRFRRFYLNLIWNTQMWCDPVGEWTNRNRRVGGLYCGPYRVRDWVYLQNLFPFARLGFSGPNRSPLMVLDHLVETDYPWDHRKLEGGSGSLSSVGVYPIQFWCRGRGPTMKEYVGGLY